MNLEQLLYLPFGNNIIIGPHIKDQLNFLSKIIPENFKGKELYDLGCGDGKITILLQKIFQPKITLGCDINPNLVDRTKKKGIKAKVIDLENNIPRGELAVMWGVLHHLKEQDKTLRKIKNNFQLLFLREPLLEKKSFLELGRPFKKEELEDKVSKSLGSCQISEHRNASFIFWQRD